MFDDAFMNSEQTISFIGSGRLATQLAIALSRCGYHINEIISPHHAHTLAEKVGARAVTHQRELSDYADVYIVAVRDDVMDEVLSTFCPRIEKAVPGAMFFHTAGSLPMSCFKGKAHHYGVLYPMQTFSLERMVDFSNVPFFIEASDAATLDAGKTIASSISQRVFHFCSEERKYLHLAAVFACNFANHCFTLADDILQEHHLDISIMMPLIKETVEKLETLPPGKAQTGPAVRRDLKVMEQQASLLADTPQVQRIYRLLSQSILERHSS